MRKVTIALLALCFSGFVYAADEPKTGNANEANNSTITDSKVNQAGRDIINNYITTPKPLPATKPKVKTKSTAASVPKAKPTKSDKNTPAIGDVTGDQNVTGNATGGGDMNINFGAKP